MHPHEEDIILNERTVLAGLALAGLAGRVGLSPPAAAAKALEYADALLALLHPEPPRLAEADEDEEPPF